MARSLELRSGPALLKAIEGFRGETSGSKEHEEMNQHLSRVYDEIRKGSSEIHDSPGRREAATAAGQREMPSEPGHSGGSGGPTSNEPGHAGAPEPPRNIAPGQGRLSGVVVPSRGNRASNASAAFPPSSVEAIRRIAADREKSRPDTKYAERVKTSDDVKANAPGPPRETEGRIGDVEAPAPRRGAQAEAVGAARGAGKQPEARPPYAQENIGDSFARAGAEARKRFAKK